MLHFSCLLLLLSCNPDPTPAAEKDCLALLPWVGGLTLGRLASLLVPLFIDGTSSRSAACVLGSD